MIHKFSATPLSLAIFFRSLQPKMAPPRRDNDSGKRKHAMSDQKNADSLKRARNNDEQPTNPSLIGPHEPIAAELALKYDVLAASVISSTQIRKRVTYVSKHLLAETKQPRVALLYARTAEVCKLITVVEQCKRVLVEEGSAWYQYNQLFELLEKPKRRDVVEETKLGQELEEDDDSDDFEVMHSRFEDAVLPTPSTRAVKSMRVFLSVAPVPELKSKPDVTSQS
ncbi:hypothetical protein B0J13DRAFT_551664 [Dactylonectria estremocensis]|uniref:DNA/RNA-binding protein Alba-like domain-containing protein n=1 Tax=Dactylonectria estremocensis TaxID=1079267 RepID=A0A9P9F0E9_9HYPO|nr:hypothetical protein B0J13DRAFT_551664 [Dactylonectria estremocensis]